MNLLAHWYLLAMQHPYDTLWAGTAFAGQSLFGVRFLIQWLSSEREGRSVVPLAFWYCSVVATLVSLAYAVHIAAWPLLPGYCLPLPIYFRNVYLVYRERRKTAAA
jgi:lipid-A-disaccharide synthase-like uncharacterized protein